MLLPFHPYLQPLHPGHIHRSSKLLLAPCKARCCWVWVGVKTHPGAEFSPSVEGAEDGGGWQAPQTLVMRWVNDPKQALHHLTKLMHLLSGLRKWLVAGRDFHDQQREMDKFLLGQYQEASLAEVLKRAPEHLQPNSVTSVGPVMYSTSAFSHLCSQCTENQKWYLSNITNLLRRSEICGREKPKCLQCPVSNALNDRKSFLLHFQNVLP